MVTLASSKNKYNINVTSDFYFFEEEEEEVNFYSAQFYSI